VIEYSLNGIVFHTLAVIAGGRVGDFQYLHRITGEATIYYRLKVIELNDDSFYSKIIQMQGGSIVKHLSVYVKNAVIYMHYQSEVAEKLYTKLIDINGRVLVVKEFNAKKGSNLLTIPCLEKLPRGVYFLHLNSERRIQTTKVFYSG
jgi:hypothetical protein